MNKQRIDYIDLMKGFCIILVVINHCGCRFSNEYEFINDYLQIFRMPLYFFLSGLFFKSSYDFKKLVFKKTNNLIIPYIFFSGLMILPNLLLYKTSHEMGIGHTLYSLFIIPQNFPLWFLRCLFFVYIIYFCLCKSITNIITRIVICFCISIIIWFINPYLKQHLDTFSYHAIYSSNIISSFFVLPFIAIAEYLRSKGLLEMNLSIKKKFMLLIIFIALWITCITSNFDLLFENYSNNILLFYISSFSGIFIILIISNILKKIIYISYMGRYSLIVLGLHILLITTIKGLYPTISPMNITIIVLSLSPLLIFFFKKYFPYFTAQKELIKCQ